MDLLRGPEEQRLPLSQLREPEKSARALSGAAGDPNVVGDGATVRSEEAERHVQ